MYVVIFPHSQSNPSPMYKVVLYQDWCNWVNGTTNMMKVVGSHQKYKEAAAQKDELNERIGV